MKTRRIITFVPADQADEFAKTFGQHIPHICGDYDSVCWWSEAKIEHGTEQYRPLDGKLQQAPSVRMEFSIPNDDAVSSAFIEKLKHHHPWEQPVVLSVCMDMK
jgi:hypothetical protein